MNFFLYGSGRVIIAALFLQTAAIVWYCIDRWRRRVSSHSVENPDADPYRRDPFLAREFRWRNDARSSFQNDPWRRRLRIPGIYGEVTQHAFQDVYPSHVIELGGPVSYRCVLAALSCFGPLPHYPPLIKEKPSRARGEACVRELQNMIMQDAHISYLLRDAVQEAIRHQIDEQGVSEKARQNVLGLLHSIIGSDPLKEEYGWLDEELEQTDLNATPAMDRWAPLRPWVQTAARAIWSKGYDRILGEISMKTWGWMAVPNCGIVPPIDNGSSALFERNDHVLLSYPVPRLSGTRRRGLHNRDGPAMVFDDGIELYFLNDVLVPEWIVTSEPHELNPEDFASLDNGEVRREFIRKVGIERLLNQVPHSVIDEEGDYSLYAMRVLGERRVYLRMKNPSIGTWHMEAVHPNCETIQQALNWRATGNTDPDESWNPKEIT